MSEPLQNGGVQLQVCCAKPQHFSIADRLIAEGFSSVINITKEVMQLSLIMRYFSVTSPKIVPFSKFEEITK